MALAVEECALPIRTRRLNPSLDNAYGVMPQGPGLANLQQLRIIRSFRSPVFAAALIGFSIFSWMPANAQTPPGLVPPGITYVRSVYNWSQSPTNPTTLSAMSPVSVTLTPCPTGIDTTSRAGYQVLVSGGGNSEVVNVVPTAGDCTPGASTGTIHFTPFNGYPAGYTVGSASSGIQETINYACGINQTTFLNAQCNVTIPANNYEIGTPTPPPSSNTYNVYGTIFLHSNQSVLSGYGVSLNCGGPAGATTVTLRGPCLQVGDLGSSNDYTNNTVSGISFRSPNSLTSNPSFSGVAIVSTQRASQVVTITTATPHGFRIGDMVTIMFTDNNAFWGDALVTGCGGGCGSSSTTFTYSHSGSDINPQNTPGVVALAYDAILDNALATHFIDIQYDIAYEYGAFNNFFDLWDDENCAIDHFNNNAIPLNANANWTGSFIFSAGNQGTGHQIAPVITLRDSNITANWSDGVTDYNSNGLYIENTVIQASGPWQVYSSNTPGNYQGAYVKNLYSESNPGLNPLSPAKSPFAGTGVAGLIAGASSGAANFLAVGSGGPQGAFATGTTSAPITALSEPTGSTTATVTSTLNPAVGSNVTLAGNVPTGFNGTWPVTLSGPSSFQVSTYPLSGLGTATGVGTASGATPYSYFVVAKDCPSGNTCPPYPSQTSPMQVLNYNSTQNDSIPVLFPRVANGTDSITYDLLRTTTPVGVGAAYPSPGNCNGGSTAACGYIATLGQCSGLVCAYTDSGAAVTQSYNIAVGDYSGDLNFWPGSIVSLNKSVVTDGEAANIVGVGLAGNPIQVAGKCTDYGTASPGGYTACLASLSTQDVAYQSATILTDGAAVGGAGSNQYFPKGRLNFSTTPFATLQPHEIITLIDSQPGLTQATWGYRPQAGTGTTADTWIGTDVVANGTQLTNGQLAFGAPVSISNYIDAVPNSTGYNPSTNWLTQLTAAGFALRTHLNQFSTGQFAGTCTMQNATTCTITVAARYTSTPGCVVTVQGSSPIAGACSVTGTTVTVTAASNNSATWAAMLFGNPN